MTNPLTAGRAREIARDSLKRATGFPVDSMRAVVIDSIAVDFIDQRIETLEACAKERCVYCRRWSLFSDAQRHKNAHEAIRLEATWYRHGAVVDCLAQFEQRELIRLRKERETLTASSRTIAE